MSQVVRQGAALAEEADKVNNHLHDNYLPGVCSDSPAGHGTLLRAGGNVDRGLEMYYLTVLTLCLYFATISAYLRKTDGGDPSAGDPFVQSHNRDVIHRTSPFSGVSLVSGTIRGQCRHNYQHVDIEVPLVDLDPGDVGLGPHPLILPDVILPDPDIHVAPAPAALVETVCGG